MKLVAIFKDATGAEWIRERHSAEHLGFLEKNKNKIAIGGSLRRHAGATPYGGLWVFSVSSKEEAIGLIEADPYYRLGLRAEYELFLWGKPDFFGVVEL
ncbi:YciI family protein [Mesorhizobium sp. VK23B]|uniref:YciI family protein n=1 Tax=Mesorhizobium dulcispinae TaxID=3072316 RepID=A0ABU4XP83_9HYPH|nr:MULTISPECIES: YciI family protein [unclassified Mesorhizobium]MDX8470176.1 YciI family protein [Mesorhizobium sp. VK23B]MDX8476548.1 YciI family protein [Mesorhizobium sp. VK23A]